MSAAVILPPLPPPSSSLLRRRLPRLTARARALLTAVNLHLAAVTALAVVVLYLLGHLLLVHQALTAHGPAALDAQTRLLKTAELQELPLRGLDGKLVDSTAAADAFYLARLPYAYSQVAAELGALTRRQNVRLARVQYAQVPVLSGADALIEVRMDASVSGDYRPVVQFLNSLERDPVFFVIGGINLTGQQSGQVNLRVRLTTYLRGPLEAELNGNTLAELAPGSLSGAAAGPAPDAAPGASARTGSTR